MLPLCVALSLSPQLLLEPRYFILPYLLLRAQVTPPSRSSPIFILGKWREYKYK